MSAFLQLIFELMIILLLAKAAGYIAVRLGQPSVLGELIMGVLLGPSLIDLTHLSIITSSHLPDTIYELGELGVLLLMFLAGLELHLGDLARNTKISGLSGISGVIVPVFLGWLLGLALGMQSDHALFLGLTLGATSVSISAQTLMELKVIRSKVGLSMLGAAVFDDILVILLLSTFLALSSGAGGFLEVLLVILRMAIFLGLSIGFGIYVLPRLTKMISPLPISQGTLAFTLVVLMAYGLAAEIIGEMAAITGTFLAGLMFGRTQEREQIEAGMRSLAYGFFVPIFFISIGLMINLKELPANSFLSILAICLVAIFGKIIGAGLGARMGGLSFRESLQLGIGMISRGEVGLIVAQVGLSQQLINQEIFSAVIAMVLVTTLVTPPLLRSVFREENSGRTNRPLISDKERS